MIKDYQKVKIISLLKDSSERESKLTQNYYKQFYECDFRSQDKLKFLNFDMHKFCKGDNYD